MFEEAEYVSLLNGARQYTSDRVASERTILGTSTFLWP